MSHILRIDASARQLEDSVAHQAATTPQVSASARQISATSRHLAETVDLQRAYAEAIGYDAHPYDALLSLYEPGETVASMRAFSVKRSKYFAHDVSVTACATATSWATIARLA